MSGKSRGVSASDAAKASRATAAASANSLPDYVRPENVRAMGEALLEFGTYPIAVTGAVRNHSVATARPGMPHRYAVERPEAVTVQGLSVDGRAVTHKARGLAARVFQHEIDHLDGVLFTDKAKHTHTMTMTDDHNKESVRPLS